MRGVSDRANSEEKAMFGNLMQVYAANGVRCQCYRQRVRRRELRVDVPTSVGIFEITAIATEACRMSSVETQREWFEWAE